MLRVHYRTRAVRRLKGVMWISLLLVFVLSLCGCTILLPMLKANLDSGKERKTRRGVEELQHTPPGTSVRVKVIDSRPVTGEFQGIQYADLDLPADSVSLTGATVLFNTGWEKKQIPAEDILWVEDLYREGSVAFLFTGLVVDFFIVYYSGWPLYFPRSP